MQLWSSFCGHPSNFLSVLLGNGFVCALLICKGCILQRCYKGVWIRAQPDIAVLKKKEGRVWDNLMRRAGGRGQGEGSWPQL